jgi:hypothetical protein
MNISQKALDAAWETARQNGVEISPGQLLDVLKTFVHANEQNHDDEAESSVGPDIVRIISGFASLVAIRQTIIETQIAAALLPAEDGDWQYKLLYDHLFEGDDCAAVKIRASLSRMGRDFIEYYDPDTTYKEDSEAYIAALDETIDAVRAEIASQFEPEDSSMRI